jgi:hypothetical protein
MIDLSSVNGSPVSWKHEGRVYVGHTVGAYGARGHYMSTRDLLKGLSFDPTTKLIFFTVPGKPGETFELLVRRGDTNELALVGAANEVRMLEGYE